MGIEESRGKKGKTKRKTPKYVVRAVHDAA